MDLIVIPSDSNRKQWFEFRRALYHDLEVEFDKAEMNKIVNSDWLESFLVKDGNEFIGMIELSLRNMVDGCISSPVAYIEGIYLIEAYQSKGLGRTLIEWIKNWARSKNCTELASDVELNNIDSQKFHEAVGFKETYRVVEYRMDL